MEEDAFLKKTLSAEHWWNREICFERYLERRVISNLWDMETLLTFTEFNNNNSRQYLVAILVYEKWF